MPVIISPCRVTIVATERGCAPSAIRTPNSRARMLTTYAITPYKPIAPSTSVTAAATPSIIIVKESCAMERATTSVIGRASKTGSDGSRSCSVR